MEKENISIQKSNLSILYILEELTGSTQLI